MCWTNGQWPFFSPGTAFTWMGSYRWDPRQKMQMGRAVIRSIWQRRGLKSSLPTAAWSRFLGCADTAGCGLHCEPCEWSFGLKTVGLGPGLLTPWSWPSPVHPTAVHKEPSEVYLLHNDCCDYSFAEECSSEFEQLIRWVFFLALFCLLLKTRVPRLLSWLFFGVVTMSAALCEAHVTQGEFRQVWFQHKSRPQAVPALSWQEVIGVRTGLTLRLKTKQFWGADLPR